jgi:formylglycine-generating enzyme required for sulfatase activity
MTVVWRALTSALLAVCIAGCGGRTSLWWTDGGTADRATDRYRPPDGRPPAPGTWVTIASGSFLMGSPSGELCREQGGVKETEHQVILTRSFELLSTEVTQAQFQKVMGTAPSNFTPCGADCPVERVNWHEAVAYCNQLSKIAGLEQCYTCYGASTDSTCSAAASYRGASVYDCPGYRLPTEAEWEYAYRAGSKTPLYNGTGVKSCAADSAVDAVGWYKSNSLGSTHPVAGKQPNAWSLYDMPGNVWEWCNDFYQQDLGMWTVTDPVGATVDSTRVLRGGSFFDPAGDMRAANRFGYNPSTRNLNIGFRCARTR